MSDRELCEDCDAPIATREDFLMSGKHKPDGGCPCEVCVSLCWRRWNGDQCYRDHVCWRDKAKELFARANTLESWILEHAQHGARCAQPAGDACTCGLAKIMEEME